MFGDDAVRPRTTPISSAMLARRWCAIWSAIGQAERHGLDRPARIGMPEEPGMRLVECRPPAVAVRHRNLVRLTHVPGLDDALHDRVADALPAEIGARRPGEDGEAGVQPAV